MCYSNNRDFVSVIVKVVDFCNFECSFCRYFQNKEHLVSSMSIDTFERIIEKASRYNIQHDLHHLTVIFHGGEPLLWGIDKFRLAIEYEKKFSKQNNNFKFTNDIQTNGSLINKEWAEFFKENNFSIGISIDGPNEINFHRNRLLPDDIVLKNIKYLRELKCHFGILSVITDMHKDCADAYYEFLVQNEIHSVGFCYCFDPNEKNIVSNEALSKFLIKLFDIFFYGSYRLHIREFEFVMKLCLNMSIEGCTFDYRKSCGNFFTITPIGDIHFCDSYDLNDISLGNINNNNFDDIKNNSILKDIINNARGSMIDTCNICQIKDICAGGCSRHVLSNGKNAFCNTFKILYPHIKDVIKKEREVLK